MNDHYILEWQHAETGGWSTIVTGILPYCFEKELEYVEEFPNLLTRIERMDDDEVDEVYLETFSVNDLIELLPNKWIVCPRCEGKGTHLRPGMEGVAYSMEEFNRDFSYEERQAYFNGGYDIQCQTCNGRTTVKDIDDVASDYHYPRLFKYLNELIQDEYEMEAMYAAERRMGA